MPDQAMTIEIEDPSRQGPPRKISVEKYVQEFTWDESKLQMQKPLQFLGQKVAANQKLYDDRLKKMQDEANEVKQKLALLKKKESESFLQKDLAEVVYKKRISSTYFVNTHGSLLMTSILIAVNSRKVDSFM